MGGGCRFFLRCCSEPPGLMAIEGEGPERGKSLKKVRKKGIICIAEVSVSIGVHFVCVTPSAV